MQSCCIHFQNHPRRGRSRKAMILRCRPASDFARSNSSSVISISTSLQGCNGRIQSADAVSCDGIGLGSSGGAVAARLGAIPTATTTRPTGTRLDPALEVPGPKTNAQPFADWNSFPIPSVPRVVSRLSPKFGWPSLGDVVSNRLERGPLASHTTCTRTGSFPR